MQNLVDNALKYAAEGEPHEVDIAVEPNDAGGRVQIRARVHNERAWVQVINTMGDGTSQPGHGIGLASARERLRLMHDFPAEFQAGLTKDGRYRVRLAVPL